MSQVIVTLKAFSQKLLEAEGKTQRRTGTPLKLVISKTTDGIKIVAIHNKPPTFSPLKNV